MARDKSLKIRDLRKEAGLSQREAAEKADISAASWQVIEAGYGQGFDVTTKYRICNVLGANLFELFPEEKKRVEQIIVYAKATGNK